MLISQSIILAWPAFQIFLHLNMLRAILHATFFLSHLLEQRSITWSPEPIPKIRDFGFLLRWVLLLRVQWFLPSREA